MTFYLQMRNRGGQHIPYLLILSVIRGKLRPDSELWGILYHFGFVCCQGMFMMWFYLYGCSLTEFLLSWTILIPGNAGRIHLLLFTLETLWRRHSRGSCPSETATQRPMLSCPQPWFYPPLGVIIVTTSSISDISGLLVCTTSQGLFQSRFLGLLSLWAGHLKSVSLSPRAPFIVRQIVFNVVSGHPRYSLACWVTPFIRTWSSLACRSSPMNLRHMFFSNFLSILKKIL